MKISCLLVSHNKPTLVIAAIASVQSQSTPDWELIIMDSGNLYDQGYFDDYKDQRIKVYRSEETEEIRKTKAISPWCLNRMFKYTTGDLISYLCDDDILYPSAFATFDLYATRNPDVLAMYGSIDLAVYDGGRGVIYGVRKALEISGRGGYPLDCRVDYLQFCHRREVLDKLGPEPWPEDIETANHSDGVFMERVGQLCQVYPIPVKIGQNRRTRYSNYYPIGDEYDRSRNE